MQNFFKKFIGLFKRSQPVAQSVPKQVVVKPKPPVNLTIPHYNQRPKTRLSRNPKNYTGYYHVGGNWFDNSNSPIFELDLIQILDSMSTDSLGYIDPGPTVFTNADIDTGNYESNLVIDASSGFDSSNNGFNSNSDFTGNDFNSDPVPSSSYDSGSNYSPSYSDSSSNYSSSSQDSGSSYPSSSYDSGSSSSYDSGSSSSYDSGSSSSYDSGSSSSYDSGSSSSFD